MSVVIADTSPVHYLLLIDQISLLPALFERVFIPATVQCEMLDPKTPASIRQWMMSPPAWLQVVPDPVPPLTDDLVLTNLDDGERTAIQAALSMGASLLLMDDRAGVGAATHRGLIVTGTLGILKLAAAHGLIDVEAALKRLAATNFRCPPALIDRIFEPLRRRELK